MRTKCVLYLVKQAQSLGWSFPKNDSNFELLGRHPSKQVGCYDNPAKRENFMSKQTGSQGRFYSVLVQR